MIRRLIKKGMHIYKDLIDPNLFSDIHPYWADVDHGTYDKIYWEGLKKTGTRSGISRRDRFYNLYTAVTATDHLKSSSMGANIAECGVFRGHSSYIMLSRLKELDSDFKGRGYYAVDSFEGLSKPTERDNLDERWEGKMQAEYNEVSKVLKLDFPEVEIHRAFIPEALNKLPVTAYRLVHIDVDLADPTMEAIDFFYPKLLVGGVIIVDDYGFKLWSGTKIMIDRFVESKKDLFCIALSTGQYMIVRTEKN